MQRPKNAGGLQDLGKARKRSSLESPEGNAALLTPAPQTSETHVGLLTYRMVKVITLCCFNSKVVICYRIIGKSYRLFWLPSSFSDHFFPWPCPGSSYSDSLMSCVPQSSVLNTSSHRIHFLGVALPILMILTTIYTLTFKSLILIQMKS